MSLLCNLKTIDINIEANDPRIVIGYDRQTHPTQHTDDVVEREQQNNQDQTKKHQQNHYHNFRIT